MTEQVILNIPALELDSALLNMAMPRFRSTAVMGVGKYRRNDRLELLHKRTFYGRLDRSVREIADEGLSGVALWYGRRLPREPELQWYMDGLSVGRGGAGLLALLVRQSNMEAFGWWFEGHGNFFPLDLVSLPGPGMAQLAVRPIWPLSQSHNRNQEDADAGRHREVVPTDSNDRLSRLAGLLGKGDLDTGYAVVDRARTIRVAVVGCGRMGMRMALELGQSEVGRDGWVVLVDGDTVEPGNLDAMLLPPQAVGAPKVQVTACMMEALNSNVRVIPIVGTLSDKKAAEAVIASEIIFVCTDRGAATVGAGLLAEAYNRAAIGLTGGGAYTPTGDMSVGGEARLSIPGSPGCLVCMGGADVPVVVEELSQTAETERQQRLQADWGEGKGGSSAAVISSVVGTGLSLFWRLLQGKERASAWLHFDANDTVPRWFNWTGRARKSSCDGCSAGGVRGLGDGVLTNG